MKDFLIFFRENSIWLHKVLFEYKLIYWDLWTIVHFMSGAFAFGCLSALNSKKRWKHLFFILAGFEALEATVFIGILRLFMPEKIPDVFMDIIVGMAGGYFAYHIFEKASLSDKWKQLIIAIISSAIVAFFWTGFYHHKLNIPLGNNAALNYIVFLFWCIIGTLIVLIFKIINRKINKLFFAILSVYIIVVILFVPLNYLLVEALNIHELSHETARSFSGIVNVRYSTIEFMVILPVLTILNYRWFVHLTQKIFAYNYKP